jgi:hypothetical protein
MMLGEGSVLLAEGCRLLCKGAAGERAVEERWREGLLLLEGVAHQQ